MTPQVREVAGARQRLRDRRAGRAPVRADARARAPHLRAALRLPLGRRAAALAQPDDDALRGAACASSTPTARRPSCPATARARRSSTCTAHGWTDGDTFSIETAAGEITPTDRWTSARAAVAMGRARLQSPDFPSGGPDGKGALVANGHELAFQHVNVGNPQCVIEVGDELEQLDLADARARRSSAASCSRTAPTSPSSGSTPTARVRARIFERGVGETLSSGTGRRRGAAVAAVLRWRGEPGDRAARRRRARGRRVATSWT